jgi:hypothetical protein
MWELYHTSTKRTSDKHLCRSPFIPGLKDLTLIHKFWRAGSKKQNEAAEQRKSGRTKKRYKGLDQAPKYVSPTLTYQYKKDYSFRSGQQVSILTLSGRLHVPYTGYGIAVRKARSAHGSY